MEVTLSLILLIFGSNIWKTVYSLKINQPSNLLDGKHLHVIWPPWSGNPKGLPGPLKGRVILDCLATRFNFTYEMVRVTEYSVEPSANGKGLFSYLRNQKCDLLLQDVVAPALIKYLEVVDITMPWVFTTAAILTHIPDEKHNIKAIIKPFQWPAWLGWGISIVCVISVFNLLQWCNEKQVKSDAKNVSDSSRSPCKKRSENHSLYVIGNLLSQGYPSTSKRLPFRIVAGVWTLAAFIFVQTYNSTLFTYVVTPVNYPLINSPYEIPERKDIHLHIKKGGSTDIVLSSASNTSFMLHKKLGERINTNPDSRCFPISQCVSLLTPGSNNIYMDGLNYHKDIIREQFKKTGKCNLQILAKDGFSPVMGSMALQKNSKYTKIVNRGLLEIAQAGLVDQWELWFRPIPPQCRKNIITTTTLDRKTLKMNNEPPALTFKNLTGAFIVLLFGISISFLVFLGELIIFIPNRHKRRLQTDVSAAEITQNKSGVNDEEKNDNQEINALNHLVEINKNKPRISIEDNLENKLIQINQNISDSHAEMIVVDIHDCSQHHKVLSN